MGFLQFPNNLRVLPISTDEVLPCAAFQLLKHGELGYVKAQLFIHGAGSLAGTEKIRMKIFSDQGFTKLMYTGQWSEIGQIENVDPTKDWIGWLTFTFGREHLNKNTIYYVAIEASGYARAADDSFYMGFVLDWPISVNTNSSAPDYAVSLALFPYMELDRP